MVYLTMDELRTRLVNYANIKKPTKQDYTEICAAFDLFATGQYEQIQSQESEESAQQPVRNDSHTLANRLNESRISNRAGGKF